MATYTQVIDALLEWSTKRNYPHELKQYFINPHPDLMFNYHVFLTNRISIIGNPSTTIEDKSDTILIITERHPDNDVCLSIECIDIFLKKFDEKFYSNVGRIEAQIAKKTSFFNDNDI